MRKTLVLSLLFAMLAVPVSAQTEGEIKEAVQLDKFLRHAIQSFGWKCNEIHGTDYGSVDTINHPDRTHVYETNKIICENNLTYFIREKGKASERIMTFCHKGVCKKF